MNAEKKAELRNLIREKDSRCKLVEPRNIKSSVWRFFHLVSLDGHMQPYACCKSCTDLLSYSGRTGTGSLLRHKCLHMNSNNGKSTRVTKAKPERGSIRVAKPKIIDPQATVTGALPQKWEQYEQTDGISDDIKDIIYSEDPLCYSPMNEMDEEPRESVMIGKTTVVSTPAISASAAVASNSLKGSLDVCIERLTTVSEQLSYIVQHTQEEQNKDDDYYFALSLVPIMRQLSLNRKLYVRAKVQEMLFKETDGVTPKEE
ncbi:uncharacterized protein LOC115632366 isoform X1 [Scaptodrosophila lebanonensis]|uniref:Uncharacterized protein LOC115632366 isoform X1 n=1 Tax=Drosophila lebanonensis TaxID=7225 RepID=A0A6J2UE04_DROLE|nr:uncharacterized protein LOC115632366 isoform X1 [Scaptodrosophila lebanonensis]